VAGVGQLISCPSPMAPPRLAVAKDRMVPKRPRRHEPSEDLGGLGMREGCEAASRLN